jgi:hypothetical protein
MRRKPKVLVVGGDPLVVRALRRELLGNGIDLEMATADQPPSQVEGGRPPHAVISDLRLSHVADRDFIPFIDDPTPLAVCAITRPAGEPSSAGCKILVVPWDSQDLAKVLFQHLHGREAIGRFGRLGRRSGPKPVPLF